MLHSLCQHPTLMQKGTNNSSTRLSLLGIYIQAGGFLHLLLSVIYIIAFPIQYDTAIVPSLQTANKSFKVFLTVFKQKSSNTQALYMYI